MGELAMLPELPHGGAGSPVGLDERCALRQKSWAPKESGSIGDATVDAACQTEEVVCSFSELQAVKGQLRSATQRLRRCQMKLAKMTTIASRQKRLDQEILKLYAREKLIFDQCLMKANAKSATAVRYKKEWLYDCLLLKVKSTAVYTFLQENGFLPLPTPRTLYGYLKSLKADFGFDASLFAVLREKLQGVPERERRGVLMFDEMSVRKSVHFRESDMSLLGKVDFSEHTRPADREKDGDHVLVFLFRPFLGGWSQTVGSFCASGAPPGSIVAKLLLQCIVHLSNAGVVVDAITCDNSTSNQSALRSLGISGDINNTKNTFQHPCAPSRLVYVVIDPHVFKCIRNNLLKVGKFLLPQSQEVFHCHYSALLEYEEEQAGLRAVPKLTKAHIFPNAFQKMSVRLAVQLFSESTAAAMKFYSKQEACKNLHHSTASSDFTRRMNKLFDSLNSRRPERVKYNEAEHITRFFGIVRHVAGDGAQPTVQHFLFIYRMLSVNNLVRPPKRASVDGDGPQLLLKLQDLFEKEKPSNSQVDTLAVLFDDVLLEPPDNIQGASASSQVLSPKECILDYLAGYFCIVVALACTAFADLVPTYAVPVAPVLPVATSTVHHTPAVSKATRVTSYETVQQGVPHTLAKVSTYTPAETTVHTVHGTVPTAVTTGAVHVPTYSYLPRYSFPFHGHPLRYPYVYGFGPYGPSYSHVVTVKECE
ncbi:hypothetical protein HPB49_002537 [Dermacentor silvarum]|uniref:Uncharacterized protein n=1 Tax=Dermacentor silvarum TaxID=543639 RepID=A0ACB8D2B6_DERSI|nr:hypothetical protein HPB49_002537 [Dermacentor silvarum]